MSNCEGCKNHRQSWELYLPSAPRSGLEATFDHHITTRNFFAWLYRMPLAGRALGKSLVDLKLRIDNYRPNDDERNRNELLAYTESQKYLDFRECIDHALAALRLAEVLHLDDLWIDAFAHCVGLSHRGVLTSPEYQVCEHRRKPEAKLIFRSTSVLSLRSSSAQRVWRWTTDSNTWVRLFRHSLRRNYRTVSWDYPKLLEITSIAFDHSFTLTILSNTDSGLRTTSILTLCRD